MMKPLNYTAQFNTSTVLRGARFVGSVGAEVKFHCCAGAEGTCTVISPVVGCPGLFCPEELRELACFLDDLADRIERGEELKY